MYLYIEASSFQAEMIEDKTSTIYEREREKRERHTHTHIERESETERAEREPEREINSIPAVLSHQSLWNISLGHCLATFLSNDIHSLLKPLVPTF